jgi:hypothetical protein|tara:strand:+ start:139 stop:405 length:267 start_codon:yes stop_codon:yes gene_type:complete
MDETKELSDFSMIRNECPKCGALWLNGQHYWTGTGKLGDPHDLAGLVCNNYADETCINPCRGSTSGDTWEKRMEFFNKEIESYESSDG